MSNTRMLLTKPRKLSRPVTGIVYLVEGRPSYMVKLQTRKSAKSKWEDVEVLKEEDVND